MSDSDVDSKSSGVAKIGRPPDLCRSYYSTIPGPPDKDGNPTVQSANKRADQEHGFGAARVASDSAGGAEDSCRKIAISRSRHAVVRCIDATVIVAVISTHV